MPHTHSPYILASANFSCVQVSHREAMALIHAVDQRGELQVCQHGHTRRQSRQSHNQSHAPFGSNPHKTPHTSAKNHRKQQEEKQPPMFGSHSLTDYHTQVARSLTLKRPNPYSMVSSGWRSRLPRRVGGAALLERAAAADARAPRLRTARRARVQV